MTKMSQLRFQNPLHLSKKAKPKMFLKNHASPREYRHPTSAQDSKPKRRTKSHRQRKLCLTVTSRSSSRKSRFLLCLMLQCLACPTRSKQPQQPQLHSRKLLRIRSNQPRLQEVSVPLRRLWTKRRRRARYKAASAPESETCLLSIVYFQVLFLLYKSQKLISYFFDLK